MAHKFDAFDATHHVFKEINGTPLETTILMPKNLSHGKHPLLVHFHGGGLMIGDRMYGDWFPLWLLQYAESKGAIIVTPDYRLLPEATGMDVLNDMKDFWNWVSGPMQTIVSRIKDGVQVDMDRIAVAGESAGGYLGLESIFLHPEVNIKLALIQYGTFDLDHPSYNPTPEDPIPPSSSFVNAYVQKVKPDAIRLSSIPPDHMDIAYGIYGEGRLREFCGTDDKLFLVRNMNKAKREKRKLPPIWFVQGKWDVLVPLVVAEDFLEKLKELHPRCPVHWSLEEGDHAFDSNVAMDEDWVQKGMEFSNKFW